MPRLLMRLRKSDIRFTSNWRQLACLHPNSEHLFGVLPQPQLMGALVESPFTFTAGKTRYFRISMSEASLRLHATTQIE
jgi:hypothetical protein